MNNQKFTLTKIIDSYIDDEEKNHVRNNNYWHGSDMGLCPRKRFYQRQGVEGEDFDARTKRVFAVGTMFHEWLQDLLTKQGCLISKEELLLDTKLNFSGHYDAIIGLGDRKILYDFKTVNSNAFSYFQKENKFPEHYEMQVMSYVYFLRKLRYPNMNEARLFFLSKDDFRTEEHQIIYTEEWEARVIAELESLNRYWDKKEIPPRIARDVNSIVEMDAWQCAKKEGKPRKDGTYRMKPYCQYYEHCWKGGDCNCEE